MKTITELDKELTFSKWSDIAVKLLILNEDGTILESMESLVNAGTLTINASSSIRRTYNFSICSSDVQEKMLRWMNHTCLLQIGIKTPRTNDYTWYAQGCFLITDTSFTYDSQNHQIQINCSDLYIRLDGTQNGSMGAQTILFPAYEEDENGNPTKYNTIRDAFTTALTELGKVTACQICEMGEYKGIREHNMDYRKYREEHPQWNCLPYDLEYSSGGHVSDILTDLLNLYPNYDGAFDENGVFVVDEIPACENDPVIFNDDQIRRNFVSESTTTNLNTIRNVCEVWGKTYETDFYSEACSTSGSIYQVTIPEYDKYYTGDIISIQVNQTSRNGQYLNINGLGDAPIYDENTEKPVTAGSCLANEVYSFKCRKRYVDGNYEVKFYLLGQWQPHALNVLTDGTVIKNGYTAQDGTLLDKYSKEYFAAVYQCDNVELMVIKDSPFTVQKIGERLDVKTGNEYDNITSTSMAASRAQYENWKNARLTDNVTIVLGAILPWAKENLKVSYTKKGTKSPKEYITRTITLDFTNCTTTIEMYTFYPLYEENTLQGTYTLLSTYSHELLSDFNHAELRKAQG